MFGRRRRQEQAEACQRAEAATAEQNERLARIEALFAEINAAKPCPDPACTAFRERIKQESYVPHFTQHDIDIL